MNKKYLIALTPLALFSTLSAAHPRSGVVFGIELGNTIGSGSARAVDIPNTGGGAGGGGGGAGNGGTTSDFGITEVGFNSKLILGYQGYLESAPNIGFDILSKWGSGIMSTNHVVVGSKDQNGNTNAGPKPGESIGGSYVPFSFRIETNFLFNFVDNGTHAFGGSLGVGYEFLYGINVGNDFSAGGTAASDLAPAFKGNTFNYSAITPKAGLHYYYQNHQFGFEFSFDKPLNASSIIEDGSEAANNNVVSKKISLSTSFDRILNVALNYTYKF